MKKFAILITALALIGCDKPAFLMTGFEKLSYEGCVKEGKYPNSICACNAANLDKALSDEEKLDYEKALLGDTVAALKLMNILGKLLEGLKNCTQ